MKFDALKFCRENQITYWEEGPNVSAGWINIQCPFCGDSSNHFGFNPFNSSCRCWRCGNHWLDETIKKLLNVTTKEAKEIIKEYSVNSITRALNKKEIVRPKELIWPVGMIDFSERHKKYLESRNFDPEKLIRQWDLKATGHLGPYKFRIIAPIIIDAVPISYQGRDITGIAELRYKTCEPEDEVIFHKGIVYGADLIQNRKTIIVEGVVDAWRMGPGTVCTFGTKYTREQVIFLHKKIDEAFILFDSDDSQAQENADRLCWDLSIIGVKSTRVELDKGDPGDLKQDDADRIKKELLGKNS